MRWTPHLEETIHIINADKECQADKILIAQVRLQFLAQEAIAVGELRNFSKNLSSPSPPELMYLKNIRLQLQETKHSFVWEVQQNSKRPELPMKAQDYSILMLCSSKPLLEGI